MARKRGDSINSEVPEETAHKDQAENDGVVSTDRGSRSSPQVDGELIKRVVRDSLEAMRRGDLYMTCGLSEDMVPQLLAASDGPGPFMSFMENVSAAMLGELEGHPGENEKGGKKKKKKGEKTKRKKLLKALLASSRPLIEAEIRSFSQTGTPAAMGNLGEQCENSPEATGDNDGQKIEVNGTIKEEEACAGSGTDNEHRGETVDAEQDDASSHVSHSHKRIKKKSKREKKKKRRDKKKHKKGKRREKEIHTDDEEEDGFGDNDSEEPLDDNVGKANAPKGARYLAAKEKFERERDEILNQIPEEVRSRFREPGFSRWQKDVLPILELGPFDVAPGPVRDQWMRMFSNCQASGRAMTRLVFWYGTLVDHWHEAYSFVPVTKVMTYEEGASKGFAELPVKIKKKWEAGKKLTKSEETRIRGLEELQGDLSLEPKERLVWAPHYTEDYEVLVEDDDDQMRESTVSEEKDQSPVRVTDHGTVKKKPKKKKKVKKELEDSSVEMEEDESMSDVPSEDDEKDENFSDIDGVQSESEEELEKHTKKRSRKESSEGRPTKRGKTAAKHGDKVVLERGRKKKSDMTEEEKEAEHQRKLAIRREKERAKREEKKKEQAELEGKPYEPPTPSASRKRTQNEEQADFEICESEFLPIMEKMKQALQSEDAGTAMESIETIHQKVGIITPPFIKEYSLGLLIKQIRKKFERTNPDVKSHCNRLTNDLKSLYTKKKELVPANFEPKKRASSKGKNSSNQELPDQARAEKDGKQRRIAAQSEDQQKEIADAKVEPSSAQAKLPKKERISPDVSVPKKNSSAVNQTNQVQPPQPVAKPVRKPAFSLKGMLEGPKTPKSKEKLPEKSSTTQAPAGVKKRGLPSWITASSPSPDFSPSEEYRSHALEFLEDATSYFQSDKVDKKSVATALESSIFEVCARENSRNLDSYWDKLHSIVAAMSGKKAPGKLVQQMMDGDFTKAIDVVKLSNVQLNDSFDSSPST